MFPWELCGSPEQRTEESSGWMISDYFETFWKADLFLKNLIKSLSFSFSSLMAYFSLQWCGNVSLSVHSHPETFLLCWCYWKVRLLVVFTNCLSTLLCSLETAAGSCEPAIDMQISVGSSSFSLASMSKKPASDRFLDPVWKPWALKRYCNGPYIKDFENAWLLT